MICLKKKDPARLKRRRLFGEMARPAGVEPATFGFGNQHSIQLSYGREPPCRVAGKEIGKAFKNNRFDPGLSTVRL